MPFVILLNLTTVKFAKATAIAIQNLWSILQSSSIDFKALVNGKERIIAVDNLHFIVTTFPEPWPQLQLQEYTFFPKKKKEEEEDEEEPPPPGAFKDMIR